LDLVEMDTDPDPQALVDPIRIPIRQNDADSDRIQIHNTDVFCCPQEAVIPPLGTKKATAKKEPITGSPAPAASPEVSHLASEAAPGGQLKLRRFLAFYQQELEVVHLCHFSSLPFR
jgi:hypothetical protein